jgi:Holliday junction DNA helicase RuvA
LPLLSWEDAVIGFLRGTLRDKRPPYLLLDVGGVGYELEAPLSTFYELPQDGSELTLYTHLLIRDDAHTLYGFASEAQRTLFRSLIKVSNVGAKLALAILSGMSVEQFQRCVQHGDAPMLTRLPGIGKRTAERLIMEMRDRLPNGIASGPVALAATGDLGEPPRSPSDDAVDALVALGYRPQEARRMVAAVQQDGIGSETLIREALRAAVR